MKIHEIPPAPVAAFLDRFPAKRIAEHVFSIIQFPRRIIAAIDFPSSRFSRGEWRAYASRMLAAHAPRRAPARFAMVIIKTAPGMRLYPVPGKGK